MSQSKQQFTPEQILDAGRRAEAQGHSDYAMQFYRHLTEHHPLSAEATLAREALGRLTLRQAAAEGKVNGHHRNGGASWPPDASRDASREAPARDVPPREVPVTREPVAARAAPASPEPPPRSAPDTRREFRPRVSDIAARQPVPLPPPVRGYLVGRIVALLVALVGFVLVAAGVAMVILLATMGMVPLLPPMLPPPVLAAGAILVGGVLILGGQMALATFATANASRDNAAVLRAIAEDIVRYR